MLLAVSRATTTRPDYRSHLDYNDAWHLCFSVAADVFDTRTCVLRLVRPLSLGAAAAVFSICLGFLYGGWATPLSTAGVRFSMQLPWDNGLPFFFAEAVDRAQIPHSMAGDWLSSDRPPLQTGIVLSHYPFAGRAKELHYQITSVILQCFWILPAWALLAEFGFGSGAMALVFSPIIFSAFNAVNSFFAWPKLLPAAFLIALTALLLGPRYRTCLHKPGTGALAGLLAAFAMLGHGGSIFALVGVAGTALLMRRMPDRKFLVAAVLAGIAAYGPWIAYQRFIDPLGNRLLKWHLAGLESVDKRSLSEALHDSYGILTITAIVKNKAANVKTLVGDPGLYLRSIANMLTGYFAPKHSDALATTDAAAKVRESMFFNFFLNLGSLCLGLIALIIPSRSTRHPYRCVAAWIWASVALTLLGWRLVMFGPDTTVIHAGSYQPVLLAFIGCTLALYGVSAVLACFVVLANIFFEFRCLGVVDAHTFALRTAHRRCLQAVPAIGVWVSSIAIVALAVWAGMVRSASQPASAVAEEPISPYTHHTRSPRKRKRHHSAR